MTLLTITYYPKRCIGNGACMREDPARFVLKGKKAQLIGGKVAGDSIILEQEFDEKNQQLIVSAAKHCPVNAIAVTNKETGEQVVNIGITEKKEAPTICAEYNDLKEFVMDPTGYFLIRIIPEKKEIEVALCTERNTIAKKVIGKKPLEIYQTCIKENMLSRLDHAAYLGRELQKAYIALQQGLKYIQDDELVFN